MDFAGDYQTLVIPKYQGLVGKKTGNMASLMAWPKSGTLLITETSTWRSLDIQDYNNENLSTNWGDMTTQMIERIPHFAEQTVNLRGLSPQTKYTTPYLMAFSPREMESVEEQEEVAAPAGMVTYLPVPDPKNWTQSRIARTIAAFNEWRHQDIFDIIFNDFFFEDRSRDYAAASPEY